MTNAELDAILIDAKICCPCQFHAEHSYADCAEYLTDHIRVLVAEVWRLRGIAGSQSQVIEKVYGDLGFYMAGGDEQ